MTVIGWQCGNASRVFLTGSMFQAIINISPCQCRHDVADVRVFAPLCRSHHLDEHIWWAYHSHHAECSDVGTHSGSDSNRWYVKFLSISLELMLTKSKAIFGVLSPHIPVKRALLEMESTEWPSTALAAFCGQANANYSCFCESCKGSVIPIADLDRCRRSDPSLGRSTRCRSHRT
jgi:choline transport protein